MQQNRKVSIIVHVLWFSKPLKNVLRQIIKTASKRKSEITQCHFGVVFQLSSRTSSSVSYLINLKHFGMFSTSQLFLIAIEIFLTSNICPLNKKVKSSWKLFFGDFFIQNSLLHAFRFFFLTWVDGDERRITMFEEIFFMLFPTPLLKRMPKNISRMKNHWKYYLMDKSSRI